MLLPKYPNSKISTQNFEPVYVGHYEVIITPPEKIGTSWELTHEQITSIDGLDVFRTSEAVSQTFGADQRHFAGGNVGSMSVELTIKCNVNLSDDLYMIGYAEYREWCKLVEDPYTGIQHLKKDYLGGPIIVRRYNRALNVFQKFVFPYAFPTTGGPLSWGGSNERASNDIHEQFEMKFRCDSPRDIIKY